jgi:hypothetical protein
VEQRCVVVEERRSPSPLLRRARRASSEVSSTSKPWRVVGGFLNLETLALEENEYLCMLQMQSSNIICETPSPITNGRLLKS